MNRLFEGLRVQRRALLYGLSGLAALGVAAAWRLPTAILPAVTFPRIAVIAESGERPGEEMLRVVTRPLEDAFRQVPGVREMRSITSRGSTEINLDCIWNSNMDLALQRVQGRVEAVRERLPQGTSVEARLMSPALFPVLGLSLTSKTRSLAELRDVAVMMIRPALARLPGAAEIVVQGGRRLEARVTLDPTALESRGLDAATVADVLKRAGEIRSVGLLDANRQLYLGLVDARPPDLASLRAIPIPVAGGPPVPLGDLGRVSLEEVPEFTRFAAQSREAVLVSILRQPTASTIGLANQVRRWLAESGAVLPADVHVETFYDQSDLVRASIGSVGDSLLIGALMAILALSLFLGSVRLGLAGAVLLPGSIVLTLLGLALMGQSLNMMTLGGIAAAVGLVLDDAVVVLEHLAHRAAPNPAALDVSAAMAEIFPSLLGSSLCTIVIFLPFMYLDGVAGAFFRVLALTMTLMLGSSLLLCITAIPLLARPKPEPTLGSRRTASWFAQSIQYAVDHPWVAVVPACILIASVLPLRGSLGTGFLPDMDEGSLIMDFYSPAGTSIQETDRILTEVEREISATPEIEAWSRRTGEQLGFFITEPNHGDYVLRLRPRRGRSANEIADDLRRRITHSQAALRVEFGQLVEDVIGDLTTSPQPIEMRIFSEDRGFLAAKARQAAELISGVRGVVDINDGLVVSGPDISILPGPGAFRLGLDADGLARSVRSTIEGLEAGQIVRGVRAWPVRVVLPVPRGMTPADALAAVRIPVASRHWVPLGDLATLRVDPGEIEIARDDQRTMASVTARLSGRDTGSAVAEIQGVLRRNLALPPDASIRFGGLWAEQQSSFQGLAAVLLGAGIAVVLVMIVGFRSWKQTGAVVVVLLASLAGVFLGLHAAGATFNISSFVGAIMMVGVVAENAYFLVASHRSALQAGATPAEAAVIAARRRARPVLMTTAAGVAALAPLAIGFGAGSALLQPLAIAVVGGFLNSAPLLLLLLPALLARCGEIRERP